ncbi:peptide ABC transporter substrate-binding protein [Ameyamaea chiangmaiensis NBRC 103196]|uniref:ABC transporter substrate-binding protein n=2 Tax=Ameyamaea chiangmaiensis TaxID=442969 RepID=A0A850PEK9_9PROT|nr:ABC transporter substrate-binding protein [Ameyamaea chiangmaiensis]MBS4074121.1 ABC transporter substrate-binding protein [Ameyamaea chiangmaiensis]NVN40900.1 ABC transporter substrate-binding protein [Ameyamaea chiangmaiensis]GBQ70953.1 peptide ABC transporter substrate-binding protein [Ameyamaea chiangmaiensis NBRC 103196]
MVPVCAAQAAPGGTLRLTAHAIGSTLDPHIAYLQLQLQVSATVYDGLMTYPKAAGPVTGGAIPDLADVRPVPQDGGLTYVFHLRDGVRFSNGKAVDVEDVAASFRRMFKVHGPTAGSYFGVLVGADACLKDAEHCALAGGVVADPAQHTVTFHLTRPDPDFLNQLGFAQAAIVPADTPAHDMGNEAPFGTGPYRYVRYSPNGGMTLERNPYFREWSHEAQPAAYPDRIEYRFGLDEEAEVSAVENGQYDWMGDGVPLDRLGEVGRRYTDRVTISDFPNIYYLALNVNEAPFNDVRVRQALNYAVNRHAMVIHEGGEALAQPACQMLPIGLAGFEPSCAYTVGAAPDHPAHAWKAPDLDRARALVRASGTAGQTVVIVAPAGATYLAIATELRSTLESLGYVASVRGINQAVQFTYIQNSANHVQAGLTGWIADYPAPAAFVQTLFSCASFHPRSDNSINMSGFCDPAIDALMDRAGTVSMTDMPAGLALWAQADRAIMEKAPAVPLTQIRRIDFVGPRVHNVVVSPVYQLLLSQLQVR